MKEKIVKLKEENPKLKFNFYCYQLGKEELFMNLARDFNTRVGILKDRYEKMRVIGCAEEFFVLKYHT